MIPPARARADLEWLIERIAAATEGQPCFSPEAMALLLCYDWPGNVREIMRLRLDLARSKGCDGVDPDNVDGYTNEPGFALDADTQLDYNRFLAQQAHARGLAIGLKNDVDQLAELEPDFDFAVNEQCAQYDECDGYRVFTDNGKPVLQVEYAARYRNNRGGARDALCDAARTANRRALVLPLQLDAAYRLSCD